VFALVADRDTLERRIAARTGNEFGKQPGELAEILRWHEDYARTYREFGAVVVDASRSLDTVVDEILALSRRCP
jgi:thymidylate kinase